MDSQDTADMPDDAKWQLLTRHEKLGEILLKLGKINLAQLGELMAELGDTDRHLGDLVVAKGIMTRAELLAALELQHQADKVSLQSVMELQDKQKE